MKFNFAPLKALAAQFLDQFGRDATLIRRSVSGDDPVTGGVTYAEQEMEVSAVLYPVNNHMFAGATLEGGDRVAYIDTETTILDKLLLDGERWNVVAVEVVEGGGLEMIWTALVRR